jgi:hypothetical protein
MAEATEPETLTWRPLAGVSLSADTWAVWSPTAPGQTVTQVADLLAGMLAARQPRADQAPGRARRASEKPGLSDRE